MAYVRAQDLRKYFGDENHRIDILRGVSFELENQGAIAVMGPSGSGKSTLLNILGTLEPPSSGQVRIGDQDLYALTERELAAFRNRHVGFIFQDHHLLPQCNVLENVMLPSMARRDSRGDLHRARMLIERVGLGERLEHFPGTLSGGERQRVAIARALINKPTLVLADEPTGNLDAKSADVVANLLAEVGPGHGASLIVVTHSQRLAERFTTRFELNEGMLTGK